MNHRGLQVRRAVMDDHRQIADLLFHEANAHRHLDWRSALDWVGSQNYWVLEENGRIKATFACPEDPPDIGWIRVFACDSRLDAREAWSVIWEFALREMADTNPQTKIAAIIMKPWFLSILLDSGFREELQIVLLQVSRQDFKPTELAEDIRIRSMQMDDFQEVERIDLAAFGNFWHNTAESLEYAMPYSVYSSVAEDSSGMIAYQISTGNPTGAHLARLAVHPSAQGKGVGSAMITDLFTKLDLNRLSVNTQSDNTASLALYKKMGFVRTGESFPVLVYLPSS